LKSYGSFANDSGFNICLLETLSVFIADIANAPAKKSLKTSVRNQKTSFLKGALYQR
jgi:hypothetical protein